MLGIGICLLDSQLPCTQPENVRVGEHSQTSNWFTSNWLCCVSAFAVFFHEYYTDDSLEKATCRTESGQESWDGQADAGDVAIGVETEPIVEEDDEDIEEA